MASHSLDAATRSTRKGLDVWLLCAWTDPILTALGVKEITPLKEFWVPAAIAVFLVQAWTVSVYIRKPEHAAFSIYLLAAGVRDLAHYWAWWNGGWESAVSSITVMAAIEASFHITYRVGIYRKRYLRYGILLFAAAGVALAARQIPVAYPHYNKTVYFIRLYTNTFCALAIVLSLVFVWRDWSLKILRMKEIQHAMILAPWFAVMIWSDRQTNAVLDAWFAPTFLQLAIQVFCLGPWIRLAANDPSKS